MRGFKVRTVQLQAKAATAFQRIVTIQALTQHTNLSIKKKNQHWAIESNFEQTLHT